MNAPIATIPILYMQFNPTVQAHMGKSTALYRALLGLTNKTTTEIRTGPRRINEKYSTTTHIQCDKIKEHIKLANYPSAVQHLV